VIEDISKAKFKIGINDSGEFGVQLDYRLTFMRQSTYASTNAMAWANQYVTINPFSSIFPFSLNLLSSKNYFTLAGSYINLFNNW